jgi:transposase-like protein
MSRVAIVTECSEGQEFTRDEVAKMLGVYPDRIVRYWVREHKGSLLACRNSFGVMSQESLSSAPAHELRARAQTPGLKP